MKYLEYTLFIKLTPEKRRDSICDMGLSLRVHFTSRNIIAVIQDGVNSNYSFEKELVSFIILTRISQFYRKIVISMIIVLQNTATLLINWAGRRYLEILCNLILSTFPLFKFEWCSSQSVPCYLWIEIKRSRKLS